MEDHGTKQATNNAQPTINYVHTATKSDILPRCIAIGKHSSLSHLSNLELMLSTLIISMPFSCSCKHNNSLNQPPKLRSKYPQSWALMSSLYFQMLMQISVQLEDILTFLGFHSNNLLPSTVMPKSVDGHNMTLLGCIPVRFWLQQQRYHDNLHFLPGITWAIISWKAAKGLGILPYHYPSPAPNKSPAVQTTTTWSDSAKMAAAEEIMKE